CEIFGINKQKALQTVLEGKIDVEEALVRLEVPGISLLPAEPHRRDKAFLVQDMSRLYLVELIQQLRRKFRYVLIDSPPVHPFIDACALSEVADRSVLIIESNRTRSEVVTYALDKLKSSGAKVLGVVLNKRSYHIPGFVYRFL
ncbi:MAG: hypothetical protein V2B18_25275, partial [Pseudomonadota bacterium]